MFPLYNRDINRGLEEYAVIDVKQSVRKYYLSGRAHNLFNVDATVFTNFPLNKECSVEALTTFRR